VDLGPSGRRKSLGVLTATVLVAALVVTGRVQPVSALRPSAGASTVPAAAPSPAGRLELGGVQFVPTSSGLRRQCREAADLLGFVVPCPMLLPASSPGAVSRRFCDPEFFCVPEDGFLFEERRLTLPEYVGVDAQRPGRLAIAAATRVAAFQVACLGGLKVATIELRGTRGSLYECPPEAGAHFGGVLLRWRDAGVVMAVSLHGHSGLNRRLVVALAAHMEPVSPSPGRAAEAPAR
jgi:hypothetical protein